MKVVILAGGHGTRLSEETSVRPKPMVEIGNRPILWHIMKIFSAYGMNDFIICCGNKGEMIKQYFANLYLNSSDFTLDLNNNEIHFHTKFKEPWRVTLVDTGDRTMTGGRIKRVSDYIGNSTFCLTYGDGVSDVDVSELVKFHKRQETLATLTAVQTPGRFGAFNLDQGQMIIRQFREKHQGDGAWVNGGFFVLEPEIMEYIPGNATIWEREPLENLAKVGQLSAYRHYGFWHPMDTLRDKIALEEMWNSGEAPWKVW